MSVAARSGDDLERERERETIETGGPKSDTCYWYRCHRYYIVYICISVEDHSGRFVLSDRGTTLALVITSFGQILNIFSFDDAPLSLSLPLSLFTSWRHFDLCCALSALCVCTAWCSTYTCSIHNNDRKDVVLHVDHHYGRNLSHAKTIAWSGLVFYGLLVPVWHTQIWRSNGTGNAKIIVKHRHTSGGG